MRRDLSLSALIVNYNTGSYAECCVASLLREWAREGRERSKLEIVLVDNASPEPQEPHLSNLEALGVTVIRSSENLGYARGINVCYERTRGEPGDVVAILNPDLHFLPGTIERLIDYLFEHPECGAVDPSACIDALGVFNLPRNLLPTPIEHVRVTLAVMSPFFCRLYSRRRLRRALVWWTSLPFGLGLGLWLVSLGALASAWRNLRQPIIVFLVGPALLMTSYWGWDPLGMMRECGHPLFVAVIGLTCIAAAQHASLATRLLAHPLAPWLQLPETWLMLWLTTLLNPGRWPVEFNQLDSAYLVLNAAALMAAAWLLQRARQRVAHGTTLDYPGRPAR